MSRCRGGGRMGGKAMSTVDIFADFDSSPYMTAPQLPLQTLVTLSKALSAAMPGDAPPYVQAARNAMDATAQASQDEMVVRLRETNEAALTNDLDLDNALDGLWTLLRDRLRGWLRYQRPGLDFLIDDDELALDFANVRAKAERAQALSVRVFGEGKLDMLSRRYPEQSQLMATLLQLVEADDLDEDLLELAGEELLPILRRCQRAYAVMVERRSVKRTGSRADLRSLRAKLQRRIVTYNTLVLTLLNEDEPDSRAVVEQALLPMITMRTSRGGRGEDEDPADEDDNAAGDAQDDAQNDAQDDA